MAQDTDEKKKISKLVIIIGGVLAGLIVIALVIFFLPKDSKNTDFSQNQQESVDELSEETDARAIYIGMPRKFLFNIQGNATEKMVQIKVQLLVRTSKKEMIAKKHIPLIESRLLDVFLAQEKDDYYSVEGKYQIRQKALSSLQKEFLKISGNKIIEEVLFTGFVMQ